MALKSSCEPLREGEVCLQSPTIPRYANDGTVVAIRRGVEATNTPKPSSIQRKTCVYKSRPILCFVELRTGRSSSFFPLCRLITLAHGSRSDKAQFIPPQV